MIYGKSALSVEQQADQLIHRGLVANRDELIARLQAVNYYRLSGYLHPFRIPDAAGVLTNSFAPGTSLYTVWRRYNFDRKLRMIVLDAIERIEVAVRTRFVYHFVHAQNSSGQPFGPFGHLDPQNLPRFKKRTLRQRLWRNLKRIFRLKGIEHTDYQNWLTKLQSEKSRASDTFVKHFDRVYGDHHSHLPLWMACELMTCETALQFIYAVDRSIVKSVADDFGFPDEQLLSWTKAFFTLRNSCAHHARIWNRVFGVKPSVPGKNKNPQWHVAPGFSNDKIGLMLTVCHVWLGKISPTTQWKARLLTLFDEFSEIPISEMGLPPNWRNHPLWT